MKAGTETRDAVIASAEKLRIKELDEHIPLGNDGLVNENNIFRWYRVQNKRDYYVLNTAYRNALRKPSVYPEIICVETAGQEAYQGDAYGYHLTDCRKITEDFWKQMGYKCTIEKEQGDRNRKKKDQLLKVKWIIEKIEKKFCRKKSMTIRPAVRQAGMGEKDLRFWNVRLIVL